MREYWRRKRCIIKKPLGCLKGGNRVYYREFMFKSWRANVYRFEALNTCVATIWRVDKFYEYLQPEHKLQIESLGGNNGKGYTFTEE